MLPSFTTVSTVQNISISDHFTLFNFTLLLERTVYSLSSD